MRIVEKTFARFLGVADADCVELPSGKVTDLKNIPTGVWGVEIFTIYTMADSEGSAGDTSEEYSQRRYIFGSKKYEGSVSGFTLAVTTDGPKEIHPEDVLIPFKP